MTVFRYDGTFEGLLCSVFEAFSLKIFPDRLIREGEPEPMFTAHTHNIITCTESSDRVWAGINKKIPKENCNMLMHVWLSEEPESDILIFKYIRKVFGMVGFSATNFGDPDVLQTKQIAQKVARERLFIIQFVRFRKATDDTFFATISPRCNALPLAINYFTDRFADQKWIIYDIKRKYGYYYDLKTASEMTLANDDNFAIGKLDESLMVEDEKLFQKLWKNYFNALTIKERINLKLQRQHMPKRFWKYLTEKQ